MSTTPIDPKQRNDLPTNPDRDANSAEEKDLPSKARTTGDARDREHREVLPGDEISTSEVPDSVNQITPDAPPD